jgi:cyclic-di-GMP phosphodiesterase TipF (flagellum assembly factor)
MVRFSAIFIAICMVLIAGSLGAVLYLSFGFSALEGTVAALVALTGLAFANAVATRVRDRTDVGGQIADLSRGVADLARLVGEIGRRLGVAEAGLAAATEKARAAAQPLAGEIDLLGNLVKELAQSVAAHERALCGITHSGASARPENQPVPGEPRAAGLLVTEDPGDRSDHAKTGHFEETERNEIAESLRRALEANRVELYLQPIVTLPQRKVRYYEAVARVRSEDGELLLPADFLDPAENAGLTPMLDNMLAFRCVQIARRLLAKNRDVGLFCNVSAATLVDATSFTQLIDFLEANRALAPSLVFEFAQGAVRVMGPLEHEALAALNQLGYRFSMDHVEDLRIEPRELAERGFRFVKVPAALLLNRTSVAGTDIHPADFSDLLGRFGIDLIGEKIESEGTVVDLLDYDVRFGQGFLFSPPRPVRAEALQGIADKAPGRHDSGEPVRRKTIDTGEPVRSEPGLGESRPPGRTGVGQIARTAVRRA